MDRAEDDETSGEEAISSKALLSLAERLTNLRVLQIIDFVEQFDEGYIACLSSLPSLQALLVQHRRVDGEEERITYANCSKELLATILAMPKLTLLSLERIALPDDDHAVTAVAPLSELFLGECQIRHTGMEQLARRMPASWVCHPFLQGRLK